MELLNRIALIVTPKRRFLEWVNRLPDAGKPLTLEEAALLRMVYLAATGDRVPPMTELVEAYWEAANPHPHSRALADGLRALVAAPASIVTSSLCRRLKPGACPREYRGNFSLELLRTLKRALCGAREYAVSATTTIR